VVNGHNKEIKEMEEVLTKKDYLQNGYATPILDEELSEDDIVPADVVFADLQEALAEVKLARAGKIKLKTLDEVLVEFDEEQALATAFYR
jgi:hypothetical protein